MRTLLAATLAATAVAGTAAATPPTIGSECGFNAISHPLAADDRYVGEIESGPVVIATTDGTRTGRITCTIQLNGFNHAAPDAVSRTSLTTTGVVMLAPSPVEFVASDSDIVVLCTQVEIDGAGTYYYDAAAGEWGANPWVSCVTPLG